MASIPAVQCEAVRKTAGLGAFGGTNVPVQN
jgi:hypothetical protein